jgi:hypothetical protein
MTKTQKNLTPAEIRAVRIRATFLILFSSLVVVLLLAVAWAGAALRQRNPPTSARLIGVEGGVMTFDLRQLARQTALELTPSQPAAASPLLAELETLTANLLYPRAQLFFREDPNGEIVWSAWVPVQKPQRVAHQRLIGVLRESGIFAPAGREATGVVGYYSAKPRGIFLSSVPGAVPYELLTDPVSGSRIAEYTTEVDLVPDVWMSQLPMELRERVEAGVVRRINWEVPTEGTPGFVLFELQGEPPVQVPWFNPLAPGAEEP